MYISLHLPCHARQLFNGKQLFILQFPASNVFSVDMDKTGFLNMVPEPFKHIHLICDIVEMNIMHRSGALYFVQL